MSTPQQTPEATLLVVDDEPSIRELLSASLRFAGFSVLTAADGHEALQHQSGSHVDLVVLDIMLPDMDGFEVLRRTHPVEGEAAILQYADLQLNEDSYEVHRAGQPVELSPTEFKLLRYLMINSERVVSKMQILDHVWDYNWDGEISIVESYISYLRRKIDSPDNLGITDPTEAAALTPLIHTKRGIGYVLRAGK